MCFLHMYVFPGVISIGFVAIVAIVAVVAVVAVVALRYPLYQRETFLRDSSHSRIGLVRMHEAYHLD